MASLFVRTISSPHACSFFVCLSIASLKRAVFYLLLMLLNRYFCLKLTDPQVTTPLSAHGMPMDGYKIWAFLNATTGQGYNFQGTMTHGMTIVKTQTECGVNGVKTWYSLNGPTVLAVANGTGGYLTSTNATYQVQADWPMFGFNAQNTRFNFAENRLNPTNVSNLALDWRYNMGANSQAVVVNGIVYTSSSGGNFVYALNATTGAYLWSYPLT